MTNSEQGSGGFGPTTSLPHRVIELVADMEGPNVDQSSKPSIIDEFAAGSSLTLECHVKGESHATPETQLMKDSVAAEAAQSISNNARSSLKKSLKITSFNSDHAGVYECASRHPNGSMRRGVRTLQVKGIVYNATEHGETLCDGDLGAHYCHNGGTCYTHLQLKSLTCRCMCGFRGDRCQFRDEIGCVHDGVNTAYTRNLALICTLFATLIVCMLFFLICYVKKRGKLEGAGADEEREFEMALYGVRRQSSVTDKPPQRVVCPYCHIAFTPFVTASLNPSTIPAKTASGVGSQRRPISSLPQSPVSPKAFVTSPNRHSMELSNYGNNLERRLKAAYQPLLTKGDSAGVISNGHVKGGSFPIGLECNCYASMTKENGVLLEVPSSPSTPDPHGDVPPSPSSNGSQKKQRRLGVSDSVPVD